MTKELDALLIRSLPELTDAALALQALDARVWKEVDAETSAWMIRNEWQGGASFQEDSIWLAPPEWMVPGTTTEQAYLWFVINYSGAATANPTDLACLLSCGEQRVGFGLCHDEYSIGRRDFNRLWRDLPNKAALPMRDGVVFVPLEVDREALALAIERDNFADALAPLRETLDRLPQLASQLGYLKQAIVRSAAEKA